MAKKKKAKSKAAKKTAVKKKTAIKKKKAPAKSPAVKKKAKAKAAPAKKKTAVKSKAATKSQKAKAAPAKKKVVAKPAPQKKPQKKAAPEKKPAKPVAAKPKAAQKPKEAEPQTLKPGATKEPPPPIKVEPRIIETPEPKRQMEAPVGDLFTKDELESFRSLLKDEKDKILEKARRAVAEGNIHFSKDDMYDEVDQASAMEAQNLNLRLLDRDRKLLNEIEHALAKIETGDFGYCEGTGEPIPKRRLELRPWTRHSVKYKEKLERMKKSGRGVVDEDEI